MIRIGVLGCGYFGAEFARAIKEREDVQLAAVYSPGKSSERLSRELGCPRASSVDEIMENAKFIRWYFGHYHDDRVILGKFVMLYHSFQRVV